MSKSLCSPLGAQSAVGLPYCRELMVSLARYFPLLFHSEEGRVVGLVDEEREERKFGVESSVRVPPGHGCLLCHPAEIGPAGSGTRQPRSSAGLPLRGAVVGGGSVITPACLFLQSSVFLGPLVPSHPCGSIIAFLVLFNFRISTLKGVTLLKPHTVLLYMCVCVCVLCQCEPSTTFNNAGASCLMANPHPPASTA